jgi:hypothetical protein
MKQKPAGRTNRRKAGFFAAHSCRAALKVDAPGERLRLSKVLSSRASGKGGPYFSAGNVSRSDDRAITTRKVATWRILIGGQRSALLEYSGYHRRRHQGIADNTTYKLWLQELRDVFSVVV